MIDATKLVEWGNYYIKYKDLPYTISYWDAFVKRFVTRATEYKPSELTDAIPIPTPEELGEMREVLQEAVDSCECARMITDETYNKARTLLEKMT